MSISGESDRCKFGCATLADVLRERGSDHFCIEREKTARKHLHISRNGVIKVCGWVIVLLWVCRLWSDVYRIKKV